MSVAVPTVRTMVRHPAHVAVALLVRDGQLLLAHRRATRDAFPDRWALPGGHLEPGESAEQAVRRECVEELGIEIHDPRPFPMQVNGDVNMDAFVVTSWTGEPHHAAPAEHDQLGWFSADQISRLALAHPEALPDLLCALRTA